MSTPCCGLRLAAVAFALVTDVITHRIKHAAKRLELPFDIVFLALELGDR